MSSKTIFARKITLCLILCLALASGHTFLVTADTSLSDEGEKLTGKNKRLAQELIQQKRDTETAQMLRDQITDHQINDLLQPTDTSNLPSIFEALAGASRLANPAISISGPSPWDGGDDFPGINDVIVTKITIEAQAPSDLDFWAFWTAIQQLGGKWTIAKLDIQRTSPNEKLQALNVTIKTELDWFANAKHADEAQQ